MSQDLQDLLQTAVKSTNRGRARSVEARPIRTRWAKAGYSRSPSPGMVSAERLPTPAGSATPHCPKPDRPCPVRVFGAHEIHPDDDVDWTRASDWETERQLRWERNEMCKALLLNKQSVQFRSSGNSLWPFVNSGDCCLFEPVDPRFLIVGDVVFCKVQRGDRQYYYANKILRIQSYQLTPAESARVAGRPRRPRGGQSRRLVWRTAVGIRSTISASAGCFKSH